ncbi:MAG: sigma factor, partial [Rubripirellula sp.]
MDSKNDSADHLDREQFVRLLTRHDRVIRAFLRSLLPTFGDVDEVMQEVSVAAWNKFSSLDDPENFCRWACGSARIQVLRYRRAKARDRIVLGEEVERLIADEGVDELVERQEQLTALE